MSLPCITVGITARNEAACIAATLHGLLESAAHAEAMSVARFEFVAVLDECTDGTEAVVRGFPQVRILHSRGGLIEAQRHLAQSRPFVIYSDADLLVEREVLGELAAAMLAEPSLQVAYPRKRPLPPRRRGLMAAALHCYNRVEGFQTRRAYFNGKLFAIRDWRAPTLAELAPRLAALPLDRFYDFHAGLRVDDIWLSRDLLTRHGPAALREVEHVCIHYRPPETFTGMYRIYLRMRREIERLDRMFPESIPAHQPRGFDAAAYRAAPWRDRWLWHVFHAALRVCRWRYALERFYYQRLSSTPISAWKPVTETKAPLPAATVRLE